MSTRDASDRTAGEDQRVIAAYEAALAVASEVTPDAVLQRIVDVARKVASAQYAALGVARDDGEIVQFITSGITKAERDAIGDLPRGAGLLGALIRERVSLLVSDISEDKRSVGFPPNHPPMRTFLGVPIVLGNRVLGNLYLTNRVDGQVFNDGDLEVVQILAAHAAAAIDRSNLYGQLRDQRDRLRSILDSLPAGVAIVSEPLSAIQFANSAFVDLALGHLHGPGVLPTYGRDFTFERIDGSALTLDERPGIRALRGESIQNAQLALKRADGSTLPISLQAAPLRNPGDPNHDAIIVIQDVTQLRQAEQLKDDFLSLISHEFRTPLTAIHGGAHLLADAHHSIDESTRLDILADVVAESDRLDRMLTNLLTLASVMAGQLAVETEPVLLPLLARQVSAEVESRSPHFTFIVEIPSETPPVEGDPSLIAQVLRNLYENAVKYSPNGGVIMTSASEDGERVTLDVRDHGLGIANEHLAHVFERFHRVGADPSVRGMGLGLYLSKLLIAAQGGDLSVSSPGPGEGSTFSISLPVARGWAS